MKGEKNLHFCIKKKDHNALNTDMLFSCQKVHKALISNVCAN